MGEFSYAQPDFQDGYGDFSNGYGAPAQAPPPAAPDAHAVPQAASAAGYQDEVAALVPDGVPLLAAVLLEKGVLNATTLHAALGQQAETGESLAQVLLEGGWAAADQLVEALQIRASYG